MLIYKLTTNFHHRDELLSQIGITVENIPPSRFSFLTAIRLAAKYKHQLPNAIIVSSFKNLIATVSAEKIIDSLNCKSIPIILWVGDKTKAPLNIRNFFIDKISQIVFENETVKDRWLNLDYLKGFNRYSIIPTPLKQSSYKELMDETKSAEIDDANISKKLVLTYLGDIGNGENLNAIIQKIATEGLQEIIHLRILGVGKAKHIMPIVKKARVNHLDINWLGVDYDLPNELSISEGFIMSNPTLSDNELYLLSKGIPGVNSDNLSDWIDSEKRNKMKEASRKTFNELYSEKQFIFKVEQLLKSLTEL